MDLKHEKSDSFVGASASPHRHVLNAPDRLMYVAHEGLRSLGHAGFSCQSHVWLDGRLDIDRLQAALARLAMLHPVVTGRIVESAEGGIEWVGRDVVPALRLHELPDDDDSSVLQQAEALLAEEHNLDVADPIAFHLLRRPCGRDVLIVQWVHALMDGKAPEFVLAELNRLAALPDSPIEDTGSNRVDWASDSRLAHNGDGKADGNGDIGVVIRRHSRRRRFTAAAGVVASHIRLPVRSVTLEPPSKPAWVFKPIRIGMRTLDAAATARLSTRVRQLCGLLNLTPAVLASVYRVIARLTPRSTTRRSLFRTDVPLNLRTPGATGPIFRNFMSFISLHATFDELHDRDELTRTLHRRMRDQLTRGTDLGNLVMMDWMSRRPQALRKHLMSRMQKYPLTLGFGFLGPLLPGLDALLGVPIARFHTLNMAMSPPGLTLQVNLCRDQLTLAATYIEAVVPQSMADTFLDGVVEDLTSEATHS